MYGAVVGQGGTKIDSLNRLHISDGQSIEVLMLLIDFYKTENIDSLDKYINKLLVQADIRNDDSIATHLNITKVNAYITFNEIEKAEKLFNEIEIKNSLSPELQVKYAIIKGRLLKSKRQFNESLVVFYDALQSIKKHQLDELLPELYIDIAFVLSQNNDLENSTKYYRYALQEANNNIALQIQVYYALCRIYNGGITVNLDSSVFYGELGVELAKRANYEHGYAMMINIVAAPLIRKGYFRKGLEMSREALTYADKYNFSIKSRYYLSLNQGFAYEKLGIYDSAMILMEVGRKIRPIGIDHFRLKFLIHKSKGEFKEAMLTLERYEFKKDSIIRGRNEAKLSSLQARHEANMKEQEVISLTQKTELQTIQLSQQRYFLAGGGILVILLLSGGVLLYRQRQLRQHHELTDLELVETKKRLQIEQQYRESELKALRSQMNPHFVFNALNSIQEYIMTNEKKLAGKYLGKFADLMRIYLEHSQSKTISINEEIETLTLYLELEKLRFEDSLEFTLDVDNNVDTHLLSIPTLLIQPYIENALKHGLLHKKADRKLSVSLRCVENNKVIECEIIDNGVGRKRAEEINRMRDVNHKPFATSATKTRLELLNYNNKNQIGVETFDLMDDQDKPVGTHVILRIPV